MILTATHTTTYLYGQPVSICHTEVHLTPRSGPHQRVVSHELEVRPEPAFMLTRTDYFGNEFTYFCIHEAHQTLTVTSLSQVDLHPEEPPHEGLTPAWEKVRDLVRERNPEGVSVADREQAFRALEFTFSSPFVKTGSVFADYAIPSFTAGRPIAEAAFDLCHRIFTEFRYDPRATTISTPVDEVLKSRRGVCQDFAHLMISCLRSLGLPARYVSGYLRSGKDSVGHEASHAWCSVYCPGFGWLDFDPTNDVMPHNNHLTIALGRDYSDVAPVNGVAIGGGEQMINVTVEVLPPTGSPAT
jgi:transglutaminase-like putative cysteine protease